MVTKQVIRFYFFNESFECLKKKDYRMQISPPPPPAKNGEKKNIIHFPI